MINLLLSLAAGLLCTGAFHMAGFSWPASSLPGTIAFVGVFVWLGRRIYKKMQAMGAAVQAELQGMTPNPRDQKARLDKAIKLLEAGLAWAPWQFLVESEIHGQIAVLRYVFKDYEGAEPHFAKASSRNYLARGLQAALMYQRKDYAAMAMHFEEAVKHGKKDGMIWAAYAWCLLQTKERDKALSVLGRAVAENPADEKLKGALNALQNDKRLKMKAWEPGWWQFQLESPPAQQPMFSEFQRRPRMQRR